MIEAVIFDMDGVLIDSEPIYDRISVELLAEYGVRPPESLFDSLRGLTVENVWSTIATAVGLPEAEHELASECTRRLEQHFATSPDVVPIPGVPELIRDLEEAGVRLAVASSSVRDRVQVILGRLGVLTAFQTIVTGDDVTASKPNPEIFLTAAARLGVAPQACAAVEDSANGMLSARAAGMRVIAYSPRGTPASDAPHDLMVQDFSALTAELIQTLTPGRGSL